MYSNISILLSLRTENLNLNYLHHAQVEIRKRFLYFLLAQLKAGLEGLICIINRLLIILLDQPEVVNSSGPRRIHLLQLLDLANELHLLWSPLAFAKAILFFLRDFSFLANFPSKCLISA